MVEVLGAGAPAVLQLSCLQENATFHSCAGLPLGVDAHGAEFSYSKTNYQPNDVFVFYSDALSEAAHKVKDFHLLQPETLNHIMTSDPFTAEAVRNGLLVPYLNAPAAIRNDDLTLVTVQCR